MRGRPRLDSPNGRKQLVQTESDGARERKRLLCRSLSYLSIDIRFESGMDSEHFSHKIIDTRLTACIPDTFQIVPEPSISLAASSVRRQPEPK